MYLLDRRSAPNSSVIVRQAVWSLADGQGLAREDDWLSGTSVEVPAALRLDPAQRRQPMSGLRPSPKIAAILERAGGDEAELGADEIAFLFSARGPDYFAACDAADQLRSRICGEEVTYVVNRNINYTNICTYRCKFCAFAKGRKRTPASDAPYLKSPEEVGRLALEARLRGATEVCLQGGIHPSFTGETCTYTHFHRWR